MAIENVDRLPERQDTRPNDIDHILAYNQAHQAAQLAGPLSPKQRYLMNQNAARVAVHLDVPGHRIQHFPPPRLPIKPASLLNQLGMGWLTRLFT
jgi:hypothetical protein